MRRRSMIIGLGVGLVVVAVAVVVTFSLLRGPSGATRDYGGELEATRVPDFPILAAERWANGAALSLASLRGNVVIVEAWAPT